MHGSRAENANLVNGLLDLLKPGSVPKSWFARRSSICGKPAGC